MQQYVLTGHEVGDIWEFDVATETWQCHIVSEFIKYVSAIIARNCQQTPTFWSDKRYIYRVSQKTHFQNAAGATVHWLNHNLPVPLVSGD